MTSSSFATALAILPKWAWAMLGILLLIEIPSGGIVRSIGMMSAFSGVALLVTFLIKSRKFNFEKNVKHSAVVLSLAMIFLGSGVAGMVDSPTNNQLQSNAPQTQYSVTSNEAQELPNFDENLAQDPHYKEGLRRKITDVVSGDRIRTENHEDVQLIGVNAPMMAQSDKPAECFATESSQKLTDLVKDKTVYLVEDEQYGAQESGGQKLFYVYLESGENVSYSLISEGYAREFAYNARPYRWQEKFTSSQESAKSDKRGLWGDGTCAGDTVSVAEKKAAAEAEVRRQQEEAQRVAEAEATARQAELQRQQQNTPQASLAPTPETGPVFSSCKQARAAGYSHMRRGEPGYSPDLDRDKDGIACDKHQ